jgi:hypothetical protein
MLTLCCIALGMYVTINEYGALQTTTAATARRRLEAMVRDGTATRFVTYERGPDGQFPVHKNVRYLIPRQAAPTDSAIWRGVRGYESLYEVSDDGRCRRIGSIGEMRPQISQFGYCKVKLTRGAASKTVSVHRLVAEVFVAGDSALDVNHINGVKTDNRASNLEWVTSSQNVLHAYYTLGKKVRPVSATNVETGEVTHFPSISRCARDGDFDLAGIAKCLRDEWRTHKGHQFKSLERTC